MNKVIANASVMRAGWNIHREYIEMMVLAIVDSRQCRLFFFDDLGGVSIIGLPLARFGLAKCYTGDRQRASNEIDWR